MGADSVIYDRGSGFTMGFSLTPPSDQGWEILVDLFAATLRGVVASRIRYLMLDMLLGE
jgi:hypothetical protein